MRNWAIPEGVGMSEGSVNDERTHSGAGLDAELVIWKGQNGDFPGGLNWKHREIQEGGTTTERLFHPRENTRKLLASLTVRSSLLRCVWVARLLPGTDFRLPRRPKPKVTLVDPGN